MEINGGHFIQIDNNNILHDISTKNGSSGSPIILLLRNFKVIGIHKGYNEKKKLIYVGNINLIRKENIRLK